VLAPGALPGVLDVVFTVTTAVIRAGHRTAGPSTVPPASSAVKECCVQAAKPWLTGHGSSIVAGVGRDAEYIAQHIAGNIAAP
jgi:hypothetical protein